MANKYTGAKHLSNTAVGELQRVNNFYISISGLPEEVSFLIKSFPLPSSENEVLTLKYGNSFIKLPGSASFSEGELTIYDSISLDTEKQVSDWRKTVYDPQTETIGNAANYKKNATITQYTPDGNIQRQWQLIGVWPSAFKPGDLASDGSDLKTMAITLQYDRAYRV